jgi:transposase
MVLARVEVITGPERRRRRRWSDEQKRAIVAESFAPGAVVAEVGRRADVSSGQIYRWRQEVGAAARFSEPVGRNQWLAAAIGVYGALLIAKPALAG